MIFHVFQWHQLKHRLSPFFYTLCRPFEGMVRRTPARAKTNKKRLAWRSKIIKSQTWKWEMNGNDMKWFFSQKHYRFPFHLAQIHRNPTKFCIFPGKKLGVFHQAPALVRWCGPKFSAPRRPRPVAIWKNAYAWYGLVWFEYVWIGQLMNCWFVLLCISLLINYLVI